MQKKLLMLSLVLLLLAMTACAKSTSKSSGDSSETLKAKPEPSITEIPEPVDNTEADDITDIPEETEAKDTTDASEDTTDASEDTTDASEEAQDDTTSEPAAATKPSIAFKTEWGYLGCAGSQGDMDHIKCYILDGYYDGDDFIVNRMDYVWIKNNKYNPLERYRINFDRSLKIGKNYKLVSKKENYIIYQDSKSEYYTLLPGFNNMVISGYMDDVTINSFLSIFTYEGDSSDLDMFDKIDFAGYHFADKIKLSGYSDIKFNAEMTEDQLPTLGYLQLGSSICFKLTEEAKSLINRDLNVNSSTKKVNKGDTFPNFKMYETSSSIYFVGLGNVPTLVFIDYKSQDAYDTLKELIVADK